MNGSFRQPIEPELGARVYLSLHHDNEKELSYPGYKRKLAEFTHLSANGEDILFPQCGQVDKYGVIVAMVGLCLTARQSPPILMQDLTAKVTIFKGDTPKFNKTSVIVE